MNNGIIGIKTYVVNSGDNLTKIAQQNNISVQDLLNVNAGIVDPNVLAVGQVINLPDNLSLGVENVQLTPLNGAPIPEVAVNNDAIAMQQAMLEQAQQAQALQTAQAAQANAMAELQKQMEAEAALKAQEAQMAAIAQLQKQMEAEAQAQALKAQQAQAAQIAQAQAIEAMNSQMQVAPAVLSPVSLPSDPDTLGMLYGVIAAEAGESNGPDEARAVASVLINRVRSGAWGGNDLRSVMTAKGQFAVISNGSYRKKTPTIEQINAINEEFMKSGMGFSPTYNYQSFRANKSGYSGIKVTPNGNEYRA